MKANNYRDGDLRGEAVSWVYASYVNLEEASNKVHGNGNADSPTDRDIVHDCTVANPSATARKNGKSESCRTDDNPAWKRGGLVREVVKGAGWLTITWAFPVEKPFEKLDHKDVEKDKHV